MIVTYNQNSLHKSYLRAYSGASLPLVIRPSIPKRKEEEMTAILIIVVVVLYLTKPKPLPIEIEYNNIRIRGTKLMAIHDFNVEQKVKITAIPNHGGYDATSFMATVTEGDAVVAVEAIAGELLSVYVKPLAVGQAVVSLSVLSHNGSLLSGTVEFNVTDLPATSLTIEVSDPEPL